MLLVIYKYFSSLFVLLKLVFSYHPYMNNFFTNIYLSLSLSISRYLGVASINPGELIQVVEEKFNSSGALCLRLVSPFSGWIVKGIGLLKPLPSTQGKLVHDDEYMI